MVQSHGPAYRKNDTFSLVTRRPEEHSLRLIAGDHLCRVVTNGQRQLKVGICLSGRRTPPARCVCFARPSGCHRSRRTGNRRAENEPDAGEQLASTGCSPRMRAARLRRRRRLLCCRSLEKEGLFVKRRSALCVFIFETAAGLESKIGMRALGSLKTSRLLLPAGHV
ncbi:hypothetical protein MRX96_055541 [Rhipicephalus microplus]